MKKLNYKHAIAVAGVGLGLALYKYGDYRSAYTLAHSPNPRIDFDFMAALLSLAGIGIVIASLIGFGLAFYDMPKRHKDVFIPKE